MYPNTLSVAHGTERVEGVMKHRQEEKAKLYSKIQVQVGPQYSWREESSKERSAASLTLLNPKMRS